MPAWTRRRLTCPAALAALIAVGLTACSGGESSSTTSTDAELTRSQLITQGDAICKDAHERFAKLQASPPTTSEEAATFAQQVVEINESEISQLRALNAPSSVKPVLDDYLKARDKQLALLKQGLDAARQSDAPAYRTAQARLAAGQVQRLQLAQAVGFKECSRPAGMAPSSSG
jgi:hypothetical protein